MNKITIDRVTVEQALEALNAALSDDRPYIEKSKQAITALRQALERPNEFHPDWDQIKPFHDRIAELEKVVRQALGALEGVVHAHGYKGGTPVEAITALHRALEQPAQQEPVAWLVYTLDGDSVFVTDNPSDFTDEHRALPLYTYPPASKPWVGLTEEDVLRIKGQFKGTLDVQFNKFAYAIEAKLREKNGGGV